MEHAGVKHLFCSGSDPSCCCHVPDSTLTSGAQIMTVRSQSHDLIVLIKEQLGRDVRQTCIPEGPTTSKAPMIPDTKWMILVKLSSPMLQEPSMTNTRSALAPLQTER